MSGRGARGRYIISNEGIPYKAQREQLNAMIDPDFSKTAQAMNCCPEHEVLAMTVKEIVYQMLKSKLVMRSWSDP